MIKTYCLLLSIFICRLCVAQNLVPNPSFEYHSNCPNGQAQLTYAIPWNSPTPGTSDYFDSCGSSQFDVPSNWGGNQIAHNGHGYAGVYASQMVAGPDIREYVQVQLLQPLQGGNLYKVKFFVSLADYSQYGVSTFGAFLSSNNSPTMSGWLINESPQIFNDTANSLVNTTGWTLIEGTFLSSGNEQYITIGNFTDDNHSGIQNIGGSSNYSYYYIDDISVEIDTSTNIQQANLNDGINIYPCPFTNNLNIVAPTYETVNLVLYDLTSRKCFEDNFQNHDFLNTNELVKGVYIYELRTNNLLLKRGKLIKE